MSSQKKIESITLKELFDNSTAGSLPILLEIYHPEIKWTDNSNEQDDGYLRLINDVYSVKFENKKYLPAVFSFTAPSEDGKTVANTSISISAIDKRVVEVIRSIDSNPTCKIVALFAKIDDENITFHKLYNYSFEMKSVTWNDTTANWELVFDPTMQLNVPRDTSTIYRNPGANGSY